MDMDTKGQGEEGEREEGVREEGESEGNPPVGSWQWAKAIYDNFDEAEEKYIQALIDRVFQRAPHSIKHGHKMKVPLSREQPRRVHTEIVRRLETYTAFSVAIEVDEQDEVWITVSIATSPTVKMIHDSLSYTWMRALAFRTAREETSPSLHRHGSASPMG